jgi:hypothetical protein
MAVHGLLRKRISHDKAAGDSHNRSGVVAPHLAALAAPYCRAHQVGEHDGDLTAFGAVFWMRAWGA